MNTNKKTAIDLENPKKTARVAGILYLIGFAIAPFTIMYIPSILIVSGDAAATANNIMASEWLFRMGIVGALITQMIFILLVLVLYKLLKPVSKNVALVMVIFLLVGVPIAMFNELNQLAVPLLFRLCHN